LVRRYTLTQTTTQDSSVRTLQPLCTCPLKDQLTGCLVSSQMICVELVAGFFTEHSSLLFVQPMSDSYAIWHTHWLPSLIVAHGTPCMTPEPLGPFVLRLAPIMECHSKPIDGWLTSFHPNLIIPTPVYVCGGSFTSVPPSPLHMPLPLPLHLQTVSHLPAEMMSPIKMSETLPPDWI